ncbi:MAG: hypothetical protein V2A64_05995 [Candidatus Omnitrophota bacterium]
MRDRTEKVKNSFNGKRGFVLLLEIVVSLIIICFIWYFLVNTYFKKTTVDIKQIAPDIKTDDSVVLPRIDTSSRQAIENSVRGTIDEINEKRQKQLDEFMRNQ